MRTENMQPSSKITIGLCVKNAGATIKDALDSLVCQDFPHDLMTIVIVDGCSRDKTISLIKETLSRTDLKYKILSENRGLGRARQYVVDNADGDYIVWVDGDMAFSADFISEQVKFMEKNPNVGIAKGKQELSPGANLLSTLEIYSRAADKMVDYSPERARSKALGTSGCIYRLKAIKQAGGFDRNIRGYGEDWDAEYRIRMAGWRLCTTAVQYQDYERFGVTWRELWQKYRRRGYDLYDVFRKHPKVVKLYAMLPFPAFIVGLFKSLSLYKLNQQKIVFFLPFQNAFKMLPWWLGYFGHTLDSIVRLPKRESAD
ncbi:MAG: glycosyltransferase [Pseudomonadota bacterium]